MRTQIALFVFALPLAAVAQEATPEKASQVKVSFDKADFPFEGEVMAERLNVRMFPSSGKESRIAKILSAGTKVTALGKKDGFFQILPPKGCGVWIYGKSITRNGDKGTVTTAGSPVRLDSRMNATKLTLLDRGEG